MDRLAGETTMCIGIPCCIVSIDPLNPNMADAQANGVHRNIDISLIATEDGESLVGQWVLVHVGFAMNKLDEKEAKQTLDILNAMQEEEADVSILFSPQDRL